jgi:hypothetical protein
MAAATGSADPHGLGALCGQLGLFSRRSAKTATLVVASSLAEGERAELLVAGRFRGEDGVAVLTGDRLVLANDREWKPDVEVVELTSGLVIEGWQDDKTASLLFRHGDRTVAIEQIAERELAQRMAAAVRARVGA